MTINKKYIKNTISYKKITQLTSFAILLNNKVDTNLSLTRIPRTHFIKLNSNIFIKTKQVLPANIYFCEFKTLNDLEKLNNNILLIKYNNHYFFKNQLKSLMLTNNIQQVNNILGFYKKFYFILKTISSKK